jgi:hypothetical protein
MKLARGVEAKRHQIGLHVAEILEAMEHTAPVEHAGSHPDYGPVVRVTGVTGTGRGVVLTVQADRLPMTLVDLSADVEAPLAGHSTDGGTEIPRCARDDMRVVIPRSAATRDLGTPARRGTSQAK